MKSVNNIFTIIIFLFLVPYCIGQYNEQVNIITTGSGKTLEQATQSALNLATEQVFEMYISKNTDLLNDKAINDSISNVSARNIKSFEILNQVQLSNDMWGVTVKTIVSIDNLVSIVKSKGYSVEIQGSLFALKIKQQILNETSEINTINSLVNFLHEPMQESFKYILNTSNPISLDPNNKNWQIPIEVSVYANRNMILCNDFFKKTISSVSLTKNEVLDYKKLNKIIFPLIISYDNVLDTFYLRKKESIKLLHEFTNKWSFYVRNFIVKSNQEEINQLENLNYIFFERHIDLNNKDVYGRQIISHSDPFKFEHNIDQRNGTNKLDYQEIEYFKQFNSNDIKSYSEEELDENIEGTVETVVKNQNNCLLDLYVFQPNEEIYNPNGHTYGKNYIEDFFALENSNWENKDPNEVFFKYKKIVLPFENQLIAKLSWNEVKSLEQIEKLTNFEIEGQGVVSKFAHGGYVVYEDNGHGLVMSTTETGFASYNEALKICDSLNVNGYDDWHLATFEEIKMIYNFSKKLGYLRFFLSKYITSTDYCVIRQSMSWEESCQNEVISFDLKNGEIFREGKGIDALFIAVRRF